MSTHSHVAEIVTFRTIPGQTVAEVAGAAAAMAPFLAAAPGFLSRHLSCADDGLWTDHVVWTDHARAREAEKRLMQEPLAQAFFAMIEPASVAMTHSPIVVAQQAA
jgi:hypothetical protein